MKRRAVRRRILAELGLLLCGVVWGLGFVVTKETAAMLPVGWLHTFRFAPSFLLMAPLVWGRLRRAGRRTLWAGAVAGTVQLLAFLAQVRGLETTTAGNCAFITSAYVVLVPFLEWAIFRRRPRGRTLLAGVVCLTGVGLIALTGQLRVAPGDGWVMLASLLFSLHILIVAACGPAGTDLLALTCVQFLVSAVGALALALPTEPFPAWKLLLSPAVLWGMGYIVFATTLFALVVQNLALRHASASRATLLMSSEAPFGALFGVLLLGEAFSPRFLLGGALVLGAILLSERAPDRSAASGKG